MKVIESQDNVCIIVPIFKLYEVFRLSIHTLEKQGGDFSTLGDRTNARVIPNELCERMKDNLTTANVKIEYGIGTK